MNDLSGNRMFLDTDHGELLWIAWIIPLPFSKGKSTIVLRYTSHSTAKIYFQVGGIKIDETELSSSGGEWREIDAGTITFEKEGWLETILNIVSDNVYLTFFTIISNE